MKKIIFIAAVLNCLAIFYPQSFEVKQITNGEFEARNPFISSFSFWESPLVYFELHKDDSSNIAVMNYDINADTFNNMIFLTTGNAIRINLYEDFNHGIAYQTNENGNWDIEFIPFDSGNWGTNTLLTNTQEDEINLSPFYANEQFNPMNNYVLFQRSDTIFVLEYNESMLEEYPVFVNTSQYHYSDYIGIYCHNGPNNFPRSGIHVVAVEIDSSGKRNLVYKYKSLIGQWEEKSFIKENCECKNPSLQFLEYSPYLIFEDSTSIGFRPFSVYDWEYERDIDTIPGLLSGNISNLNVDRPDLITLNPSPKIELEFFPHSYFINDGNELKIRLNALELGAVVGDTTIDVRLNPSTLTLGSLGLGYGEIFYTVWEDSSDGHIHLFGRRQLYPVGDVSDESNLDGFILEQNYPNPFNPSTVISYWLPITSNVTLIVYDVLGNEIATLVNEEKPAGEYKVTFDSHSGEVRNLTSGVYFYQLKAGSFIQTKKMILIK
jgi:hypothetical protein